MLAPHSFHIELFHYLFQHDLVAENIFFGDVRKIFLVGVWC